MNKTDIEWCDYIWNPVTGCLHGCEYCYARAQVRRFAGHTGYVRDYGKNGLHELDVQAEIKNRYGDYRKAPYPFGFAPTFHRYRLDEPAKMKKPQNIFVVSMGDLFGTWVPDKWIQEVFRACEAAPWHRYLFLTKNPRRYADICANSHFLNNANVWCGVTQTGADVLSGGKEYEYNCAHSFVSIEPLRQPGWRVLNYIGWHNPDYDRPQWVIIGAETGNRKDKVIPKREWIERIAEQCRAAGVSVFMKDSLIPIMGEENMIRELPWEDAL